MCVNRGRDEGEDEISKSFSESPFKLETLETNDGDLKDGEDESKNDSPSRGNASPMKRSAGEINLGADGVTLVIVSLLTDELLSAAVVKSTLELKISEKSIISTKYTLALNGAKMIHWSNGRRK